MNSKELLQETMKELLEEQQMNINGGFTPIRIIKPFLVKKCPSVYSGSGCICTNR